ncbi:FkbM family methyltransferase [Acuticoccus sp. MNP-M23]|uniref:FkbM family methyltransferase n=1 Tax=Acuticoccus sp. MNP-M23 TaxID=3072793 RepID=UPI002815FB36|nr:FkbM family methyltransferase [Acuticoccus sp. MNP-M23]WMS41655.1 FkbM family methyltransferase [Acuticoccus sp. MNP-M23]
MLRAETAWSALLLRGRGPYEIDGMVFEAPDGASPRFHRRLQSGKYELSERGLVTRHVPKGARVLELGGCIGVVACKLNRHLDDPGQHVVLELDPDVATVLAANGRRNNAGFHVVAGAVSRRRNARVKRLPSVVSTRIVHGKEGEAVAAHTIDGLEKRFGVAFDTLVMDIEGGEVNFVRDFGDALKRFDTVMVEVHWWIGPDNLAEVEGAFSAAGLTRVDSAGAVQIWKRQSAPAAG